MRSPNKKGVIGTEHRALIQIISEKKKSIAIALQLILQEIHVVEKM